MTKHFIALADHLRSRKPLKLESASQDYNNGRIAAYNMLILDMADFCQAQNPNFNRTLWIDYVYGLCGPNGGPPKKTTLGEPNE